MVVEIEERNRGQFMGVGNQVAGRGERLGQ